jgi:hypothetical protein
MTQLDDLFVRDQSGPATWYDLASPEARAFMDAVADRAVELGKDPVWAAVLKRLEAEFDTSPSASTVRSTLRGLIKARS